MMTLKQQLQENSISRKKNHILLIPEPDIELKKFVDKLQQTEITRKLEENRKLSVCFRHSNN